MAFKVRNLMIHVFPDVDENSQERLVAGPIRYDCLNWASLPGGCIATSALDPIDPRQKDFLPDPIVLAILKRQLQDALAIVQEEERAIDERMRLKTVEDAQALEDQLEAALKEVRLQKEQLLHKTADGQEDGP